MVRILYEKTLYKSLLLDIVLHGYLQMVTWYC